MYLRSLYLQQFRNYREVYFEFDPSLNLICGPNAQGKTSVLEAIHYLMMGRSFRPCQQQDLIQLDTSFSYLEAIFDKYGVNQTLRVRFDPQERKMMHNSTSLSAVSYLLGHIQGVVMTPDDVHLIKGSPALRRQFLDGQIAQVDPLYVHYLTRYGRAMRQRNQLLKQRSKVTIESWEQEMARAAAYIVKQRRRNVTALESFSQRFYTFLTEEKEELSLVYKTQTQQELTETELVDFYLRLFHKHREREMMLGYTWTGPHKDDVWVGIGGRDSRLFASEGQQRSLVIALHVAEWQQLKAMADDSPLLMVDDVGVSLDDARKSRLLDHLVMLGQVFLTTTDEKLLENYEGSKKIFQLNSR